MSGHSKWSTIKRKKGALDAKRGKIFTKLIKEISISIKDSGNSDIDSNPRLRLAVQNAKGANMPKDNIERAIKKASGADGETYVASTFEGKGHSGIAVFVECLSDNNNRTVGNVRFLFNKYNGALGTNGSLSYMFDRKGVFTINIAEGVDAEELELELIDFGAEDFEVDESVITITCALESFGELNKKLEEMEIEVANAELQRVPTEYKTLDLDSAQKAMKLIDMLEEDEDVQNVFHNLEMTEELMNSME